jgi:hypothetical protein
MKTKLTLTLAALMLLPLGASAQFQRDDHVLFDQGYQSGYRCTTTGHGCNTDRRTRDMTREERRAFDRGFHRGVDQARRDNGWRPSR